LTAQSIRNQPREELHKGLTLTYNWTNGVRKDSNDSQGVAFGIGVWTVQGREKRGKSVGGKGAKKK